MELEPVRLTRFLVEAEEELGEGISCEEVRAAKPNMTRYWGEQGMGKKERRPEY